MLGNNSARGRAIALRRSLDPRKCGLTRGFCCLALALATLWIPAIGGTAQAATQTPSCAWQNSSLAANTDWPDSNADYWITPFTATSDLTITVHGTVPNARYFSITAYNAFGIAGTANVIHDSQITHDPDGTFTVTVGHSAGSNTIAFANLVSGATNYLEFRTYVPVGNVSLPSLTFSTSAGTVTPQQCSAYAAPNYIGLFNNPDAKYVQMYPTKPIGNTVTVISGQAPSAVGYWSLCSYAYTSAVVDCRYDGNTPLSNGYYHVVLGQPSQQSAIVAAGYTYLQYGAMVMLRNLLGNQTTGAYAPVVKTCAITDRGCIGG